MNKYDKNELEVLIINQNKSYSEIGKIYGVSGAAIKKGALRLGISLQSRRNINNKETFNKGKNFTKNKLIVAFNKGRCKFCDKEIILYPGRTNEFCSHKCHNEFEHHEYIARWKRGEENGTRGKTSISTRIKKYLFEKNNNSCERCNWNEKNEHTNNIPLQIHHIDGDCLNNGENNLELLCPNCHSLTDNFGSRNKNDSAKKRSKHSGR